MIRLADWKVPWGPLERLSVTVCLHTLCHTFGPASFFITFAPKTLTNELVLANRTSRVSKPAALELRVQEEYFNLIKSGDEKVVEARPCYKYLRHYVKGDLIKFVNSADEIESFVVRIAGKQIYGSFEEMLEEETERRQIKSGEIYSIDSSRPLITHNQCILMFLM